MVWEEAEAKGLDEDRFSASETTANGGKIRICWEVAGSFIESSKSTRGNSDSTPFHTETPSHSDFYL